MVVGLNPGPFLWGACVRWKHRTKFVISDHWGSGFTASISPPLVSVSSLSQRPHPSFFHLFFFPPWGIMWGLNGMQWIPLTEQKPGTDRGLLCASVYYTWQVLLLNLSYTHRTPPPPVSPLFPRGYMFAGLEFGAECYCGHKIQAPNASESECNMECKGEKSNLCGGANRLSIYRLELSQESARRCESDTSATATTKTKPLPGF